MANVAALLEQERAKVPKERFYAWRPPDPLRILSKMYPKRYELRTFTQYDGRRGSVVSKSIDTLGPYIASKDLCLREFSKSLCDRCGGPFLCLGLDYSRCTMTLWFWGSKVRIGLTETHLRLACAQVWPFLCWRVLAEILSIFMCLW